MLDKIYANYQIEPVFVQKEDLTDKILDWSRVKDSEIDLTKKLTLHSKTHDKVA